MPSAKPPSFATSARALAAVGRRFYSRGWVLGTSGNFSVVLSHDPLQLAITASSLPKGGLAARDILRVDDRGTRIGRGSARPSAETLLHVAVARARGAGAILHTHSVWSTILSGRHASHDGQAGLVIEGFEMLKGLDGVGTHAHREWIPILENDQDMTRLSQGVAETLREHPSAHAFVLRGHGLYTWGRTLADAERHVEILEFLLEALGRRT
jgi:methylthioribulose-1-phosphate dehydratase